MGEIHDNLATYFGDYIMMKIRKQDMIFKQIFSERLIRTADWDWPRPDYVCMDEEKECTYALEFKPPNQSKREYLTGLGQSVSYLQKHLYAGLIVPDVADDGFQIARFIRDTLEDAAFNDVALSLFSYDPANRKLELLRGIKQERKNVLMKKVSKDEAKTFWCWWRECSQYELFDLLNMSFIYNEKEGDIYTNNIYPKFYDKMVSGKTRTWEGIPRKKKGSMATYTSEKQNYKIPLSQLQLWNNGDCKLTDLGLEMLEIGKKYGPNSEAFLSALTYIILVDGKHLELIKIFEEYQKTNSISEKQKDFLLDIEGYLTRRGCIGERKPGGVTTNAKVTYIRDEPKLWNKLGLLEKRTRTNVFFPKEGYRFDWHKIADMLIMGSEYLRR